MNSKSKEILVISGMVLLLITIVTGGTYAFFNGRATSGNNDLSGRSYEYDVTATLTPVRTGGLVPTMDNLIGTSVTGNNKCVDKRGYSLCSLYQITLTNSGETQTLNGYLQTESSTTYTTDHLKYQLYNSSYTDITSALAISHTANTKNYFKLNNNNINISLANGSTVIYYLVIWLSDINDNQLEDVDKQFVGSVIFESSNGTTIASQFVTT